MNFSKLSSAPSRLQPDELSDKTTGVLSSFKQAITYLNLVKGVIDPLSTRKEKYWTIPVLAPYTVNPLLSSLTGLLPTTTNTNNISFSNLVASGYTGNPLSVYTNTVYYAVQMSGGTKYFGAFKRSTNDALIYSVNTATSSWSSGSSWKFSITAPPTTLAVWPLTTTTSAIVTNPTTAFGTYGQVCGQENSSNVYFFARTRWKRAAFQTY